NKAANRAYVACANAFALTFIDGNGPGGSYRVVGHLPLPFQPSFLNVDDAASLIYVTSGSSPTPGLTIVRDMNGALDGVLTAATASTPTARGGTTAINANGTVRYTPAQNVGGLDTFTYTATDGQRVSNSALVSVIVVAPLTITTTSPLPAATINQPYAQQLSATGGAPLTFYLPTNNQFPPGLSLSSTGLITGNPTSTG